LAGVRRRRIRTLRRRRVAVAAFAALLLVVLGPILLLRPSTVTQSPGEAVRLVAAPAAAPTFPLTPTWTPGWVGLRTFTYQAGVGTTLRYERTYPRGATLAVTVGPAEPTVIGEPVTVGSHQATIDQRTDRIEVAWAISDGWVLVAGIGRVTREEVLQFAASLEDTPLQMEVPFALTVAPEGAQLVGFDRSSMEFRRAGASGVRLTITLVAAPEADRPVDEFRGLAIEADAGWGLTDVQLDMILNGVRVNDIALTGGG
jgi:hypothetical protein